jgi:hypothetical protein
MGVPRGPGLETGGGDHKPDGGAGQPGGQSEA